jgi:cytoplasmic iron level regulating protein YaaA (DUF328/UPF0246 family)
MLILLSPAKAMNFAPPPVPAPLTRPVLEADTAQLAASTRRLSVAQIRSLMDLSEKLAVLNRERFQAFDPEADGALQAAFAFNGDVYAGLKARELGAGALAWAQDHVRILSGLYGVLRPLDGIQPYRLEMGSPLRTRRGKTLYSFWGDRLGKALAADLAGHADPVIVNAASQEYASAVDRRALGARVVDIRFLEEKDGQSRIISFFAKRARGLLARYAIDNRIERADDLRAFDRDGYRFLAGESSADLWVFSRPQPAPAGADKE